MRIVPNSTISLHKNIPIDTDEQLVFSSIDNQTNYFFNNEHLLSTETPCTVVKKTGALRISSRGSGNPTPAQISTCNYISFRNPAFDNKRVYARIVDYEYVNNETTEIAYVIDYWQTWMFDVSFDDMYIEREHLSQADYEKSLVNPYDPSILEFRTAENLPIAKELEKPKYTITNSSSEATVKANDGVFAGGAITDAYPDVGRGFGCLIYLAEIDVKDLDSQVPRTAEPLAQVIDYIGKQGFGFYYLTDTMYDGLKHYSSDYYGYSFAQYGIGGSWQDVGVRPGGLRIPPGCTLLYIPNINQSYGSQDEVLPTDMFSKLLEFLTTTSSVQNIINMFVIPSNLFIASGNAMSSVHAPLAISQIVESQTDRMSNIENKKLALYPFSYMRLIAPNGDIKELQYEKFFNVALNGAHYCEIALMMDIFEKPVFIASPNNYIYEGISPYVSSSEQEKFSASAMEGLIFQQFPTMPYTIDAFLAQSAAIANELIGNNTLDYQYELKQQGLGLDRQRTENLLQLGNAAGDLITNLTSGNIAGAATGAIRSGVDYMYNTQENELATRRFEQKQRSLEGAYYSIAGYHSFLDEDLFRTRPAYAANIYHPSNGDGAINNNLWFFNDIVVLRVSLNDNILAKYDLYFKNFGFNSERCGIPRVINYTKGITDTDKVPHWTELNGKQTTFIKTTNCRVTHAQLPVATYIKSMFDRGVRMIKGD